ncbi:MAG TPA: hypothetical protein VHZ74_03255 [Bryobacteraceae bacterium]|nr:hypothetical protein [Bryobacteraceae bacterium]
MSKTLFTVAKSGLILVGGAFGLFRSLRILDNLAENARTATENAAVLETLGARIDTVHLAVARLGAQSDQLQLKMDQMVTKEELDQTLNRVFGRLQSGVDVRFEHQSRAVEALRMMVGQTDELLQRVLDGLELMKTEDDALNLTHAVS